MRIDEYELEAAAAAIQRVVANRSGRGRNWFAVPEAQRRQYREEARAALEAASAAAVGAA
ncbi:MULTISPECIES: hypothetical protein [unclassified Bradyrhizobium]|uniref:hypothetical protein n=1 Tax=unclassified Bradyrhizobium TaxID=2631580 RepID=UPI002916FBD7|nr:MULTISPECIES: hypothetical protein [unclassified Bradyrhizobium]